MCPFHKMCVHSKEVKSEETYHKTIVHGNKKSNVIKIKTEDEVESPCVAEEAYSNSQGERLAEDPPVESFLSFMQIKEEPQDISVLTGTGEVASPHPELLSCTDTDDFSSCVCPLYDAVTEDLAKMRRAKAAAARRECRRRQFEAMTEEERKVKHREEAIAQKKYRQRKLESMTEEQRRAYRSAIAETQRMRRHLRMENMTEEELKAHRASAAAAQRQKRQLQRQQMTEEELQMHRSIEAALRRSRRQAGTKRELGTHRKAAAIARREIQQCHIEEGIDDEQIEQYVIAETAVRQELREFRRESSKDEQQPAVIEGETSPEDLMVQLLMQAQQHAATRHCGDGEHQIIKKEKDDYSQENRMTNEHTFSSCMAGQPHTNNTDHYN
ncbi:uncharacterized protein [Cherax quadricarinatus]